MINQFKSTSGNDISTLTDFIGTGAGPKEDNFRNFVFNDETIDFYFSKYQVAPGVYEEQKVILPRMVVIENKEESADLANPASKTVLIKAGH